MLAKQNNENAVSNQNAVGGIYGKLTTQSSMQLYKQLFNTLIKQ